MYSGWLSLALFVQSKSSNLQGGIYKISITKDFLQHYFQWGPMEMRVKLNAWFSRERFRNDLYKKLPTGEGDHPLNLIEI